MQNLFIKMNKDGATVTEIDNFYIRQWNLQWNMQNLILLYISLEIYIPYLQLCLSLGK